MKNNFYIESIESLVANNFYASVQLDFFCTLYQVENDTQSNVGFFECSKTGPVGGLYFSIFGSLSLG